ncbi:UDP-GalNAc:beta-1,3-N-acetylgalactosaminyltransferase 1-like isoform X2 [Symsagittifera roscoffensis]|uniref:UDP-GalNAc:beta-1, 3-N-acetylgalactosaminyltransferase 1-like isoform X2 n=1 Tax=Symsagittifera roscoffensis TaxID=84072 RepID=UPI00307B87A1
MRISNTKVGISLLTCLLVILYYNNRIDHFISGSRNRVTNEDKLKSTELIFKKVLIAVPSVLSRVEERRAVRESWGDFSSWPNCEVNLKLVFYVGNPKDEGERNILRNELREFGDLELLNFTEGYYGLTEKTKLIIQSVAHKAQLDEISFDYLIKTDDDTFVNIPLICANFANFGQANVYGGNCHMNSVPYRKTSKTYNPKFIVTSEEYSRNSYPPHCEGAFYYMSKDLVSKLSSVGFKNGQYLKFEDVYVGLAFEAAGVTFRELEKRNYNYYFLFSFQKTSGFEIGYSTSFLKFIWAFHPVITLNRLKEMHQTTISVHTRLRKEGVNILSEDEDFSSKVQRWLLRKPEPIRYQPK